MASPPPSRKSPTRASDTHLPLREKIRMNSCVVSQILLDVGAHCVVRRHACAYLNTPAFRSQQHGFPRAPRKKDLESRQFGCWCLFVHAEKRKEKRLQDGRLGYKGAPTSERGNRIARICGTQAMERPIADRERHTLSSRDPTLSVNLSNRNTVSNTSLNRSSAETQNLLSDNRFEAVMGNCPQMPSGACTGARIDSFFCGPSCVSKRK